MNWGISQHLKTFVIRVVASHLVRLAFTYLSLKVELTPQNGDQSCFIAQKYGHCLVIIWRTSVMTVAVFVAAVEHGEAIFLLI